MPEGLPWAARADGLSLVVRLTPRGGRDALGAVEVLADGRSVLAVRVRAAPTEGEANAALIRLVAASLGLPARDVALRQGAASRIKILALRGESALLTAKLVDLCRQA